MHHPLHPRSRYSTPIRYKSALSDATQRCLVEYQSIPVADSTTLCLSLDYSHRLHPFVPLPTLLPKPSHSGLAPYRRRSSPRSPMARSHTSHLMEMVRLRWSILGKRTTTSRGSRVGIAGTQIPFGQVSFSLTTNNVALLTWDARWGRPEIETMGYSGYLAPELCQQKVGQSKLHVLRSQH